MLWKTIEKARKDKWSTSNIFFYKRVTIFIRLFNNKRNLRTPPLFTTSQRRQRRMQLINIRDAAWVHVIWILHHIGEVKILFVFLVLPWNNFAVPVVLLNRSMCEIMLSHEALALASQTILLHFTFIHLLYFTEHCILVLLQIGCRSSQFLLEHHDLLLFLIFLPPLILKLSLQSIDFCYQIVILPFMHVQLDSKILLQLDDVGIDDYHLLHFAQNRVSLSVFEDHPLHLYIELLWNFTLHVVIQRLHELLQNVLYILQLQCRNLWVIFWFVQQLSKTYLLIEQITLATNLCASQFGNRQSQRYLQGRLLNSAMIRRTWVTSVGERRNIFAMIFNLSIGGDLAGSRRRFFANGLWI